MDRLNNRAEVLDMLRNLLAIEKGARDRYAKESVDFENEEIRETVASIKKDEDRHVAMVEDLINELEGKNA